MNTAFADSSFYVALLIARDVNHVKATEIADAWVGNIVTSDCVLTEVANYLSGSPLRRFQFGRLLASIESDPSTEVLQTNRDLWKHGANLYLSRPDKGWSLTDCISFAIMRERGLVQAFTADHHFEQAGYTALLRI